MTRNCISVNIVIFLAQTTTERTVCYLLNKRELDLCLDMIRGSHHFLVDSDCSSQSLYISFSMLPLESPEYPQQKKFDSILAVVARRRNLSWAEQLKFDVKLSVTRYVKELISASESY